MKEYFSNHNSTGHKAQDRSSAVEVYESEELNKFLNGTVSKKRLP